MYFISCQPEKLFETEFAERGRFVLECEHDSQYWQLSWIFPENLFTSNIDVNSAEFLI